MRFIQISNIHQFLLLTEVICWTAHFKFLVSDFVIVKLIFRRFWQCAPMTDRFLPQGNIPPPGIPRAFDTFFVPGRRGFDYQSLPGGGEFDPHAKGVENLNRSLDFMWNLWPLCTWRAIMAGTPCASNVGCILTDWQVNEVNIVVKYSNIFPIPKLDF